MATVIGAVGGALVVFAIPTIDKMKIDDPVGAISVHGGRFLGPDGGAADQ